MNPTDEQSAANTRQRGDKLKPGTKSWHERQRRHRHNGYLGHVTMLQANMRAIIASDTTTLSAKTYARQILAQSEYLKSALKERIDATDK